MRNVVAIIAAILISFEERKLLILLSRSASSRLMGLLALLVLVLEDGVAMFTSYFINGFTKVTFDLNFFNCKKSCWGDRIDLVVDC